MWDPLLIVEDTVEEILRIMEQTGDQLNGVLLTKCSCLLSRKVRLYVRRLIDPSTATAESLEVEATEPSVSESFLSPLMIVNVMTKADRLLLIRQHVRQSIGWAPHSPAERVRQGAAS
jgi:hypothetical protein